MTDNLIERLRGYGDGNNDLMDAAADRIEKLEAALHKLSDSCDCWPAVQERGLARKLLETKND